MTRVFALGLLFALASCGGGGSSSPAEVSIRTTDLPQGNVGYSYFEALDARSYPPVGARRVTQL